MTDTTAKHEFKLGVFSVGDLIALAAMVFFAGAAWVQISILSEEKDRMETRVQSLEMAVPSEYVRRAEYREDLREIKELLRRIEAKVDTKADKR